MKRPIRKLIVALLFLWAVPILDAGENTPADAAIEGILRERIDAAKQGVGIVVGLVDEKGQQIICFGKLSRDSDRMVDGNTVFEIGSATKVFSGLLLADEVERGEMKLDDPISKYLPPAVKVSTRNGRQITLLDLATHASGLPRMPDNFAPRDANNPYADYTVEQMYAFISGYTLPRDIGAAYEYSNLGAGLLGHIIARKAGADYESLVRERICGPLGMTNTQVVLSPALKARLATGHNPAREPVPNWTLPTLAGAGALRSTANDMLKFIAGNLGLTQSTLQPAMQLAQAPRRSAGAPEMQIGLCWHILNKFGTELIWHNGGTGGYHAFIGFDKKQHRGVVVLANSANSIDDIGLHLLESRFPLAHFEPMKDRVAINLKPETLDRYVGRYAVTSNIFFNLRRDGGKLMAQLTGQQYCEIFPESETDFFYKVANAQITFSTSAGGKVQSLVLHQNGLNQAAKKISDKPPEIRRAVKLDPGLYDAYVGEYQLAPGAVFTILRDGNRLLARLTGQGVLEIFPESETEFFYDVVDAQIIFVKDKQGKVTDLILHQNGQNPKAPKIK
ncbi:MAG: serine hydrolase [Kiritimatiellae bacterium]|nr:serine hydrolase [Kiritimatiellia bacterium]